MSRLSTGDRPDWDAFVLHHPEGTLFHLLGWMDAVAETFSHQPVYLIARREGKVCGVLPLFVVRSWLAGTLLVSVPYAVYGGIVADDADTANALFGEARMLADACGARCIDFRSRSRVIASLTPNERYVSFAKTLPDDPDQVLGTLPRKARAAARKARFDYRLTATFGADQLRTVWRLYTISMKRLGSLNYPFEFFERLADRFAENTLVSCIRHEGRPVAGLVTFAFRDTVMPYFVGTAPEAERVCASNFVYLTLMERAVEMRIKVFDFGRSRVDNHGTLAFKKHQGFNPEPLGYQFYVPPGRTPPNLTPSSRFFKRASGIYRRLPCFVTRPVGAWLAGAVPG